VSNVGKDVPLLRKKIWVFGFVVSPVWLEGDLVIARQLAEVFLQLPEKFLIAFCLIQGHEGVDVGKLSPGDGLKEETAVRQRTPLSNTTSC